MNDENKTNKRNFVVHFIPRRIGWRRMNPYCQIFLLDEEAISYPAQTATLPFSVGVARRNSMPKTRDTYSLITNTKFVAENDLFNCVFD